MKFNYRKSIAAAASTATIAASFLLVSCEGRKMSNMEPTGETVEVVINDADTAPPQASDSSQNP